MISYRYKIPFVLCILVSSAQNLICHVTLQLFL